MKRMIILSLSLVLIIGLLAGCGSSSTSSNGTSSNNQQTGSTEEQKKITFKLGHDLLEDTPQHKGTIKFKELIEERSNGRIQVQLFPANQLGNSREMVEMAQTGTLESTLVATAKLSGFAPALQLPDLPFLFPDKETTYKVLDSEIGDQLLAGLESVSLKGVSFWESGFKQFTTNKEIHSPADFQGLKMRTMESPVLIEQFKALGSNPVPIDFAEVYNSLQQKVVDGQENPLVSITKMRFYEVQSNLTLSNHGYLAYTIVFGKKFWDGLTPEDQKLITDAAKDAAVYERGLIAEEEQAYLKQIEEYGKTKILELTPEEREAFVQVTRPVHDKFADVIGKELLEATYKKIEEVQGK